MSLEPAWSLSVVLIVGMAGVYLWYLAAHASLFDRVFAWPREHWESLWMCPWCSGFWLTAGLLLVTGTYDPVTHLAAAGVAGVIGSHT